MKKFIPFLSAAALLLSSAPVSAIADDLDPYTYEPTIYFKATSSAPAVTLPSGMPYINTKEVTDTVKLPSQVFIKDECKCVGQFTFKWLWSSDDVYLDNVQTPVEAGLSSPYTKYNTTADQNTAISKYYNAEEKMMGIDYSNVVAKPLVLAGEASDSFPVALFDLNVKSTASPEYYDITFKTEQPYVSNIAYRINEGDFRDVRPKGEYAPPLKIAVSDRALGDVNDDGILDGRDATAVLTDYAKVSANKDSIFNKAQSIAADVNGNLVVDGVDATILLTYYAYNSTHSEMSLIDFMNK